MTESPININTGVSGTDLTKAAAGIYTSPAKQTVAAGGDTLDKQAFLDLLVAQLKYQDPSSPMDTNQMMQQTTQLGMMEQLTTLTTTAQESFALQMRQSAAALVGHEVSYVKPDGTTARGTVTSVSYAGAVPELSTADKATFALDAVSAVNPPAADSGSAA